MGASLEICLTLTSSTIFREALSMVLLRADSRDRAAVDRAAEEQAQARSEVLRLREVCSKSAREPFIRLNSASIPHEIRASVIQD